MSRSDAGIIEDVVKRESGIMIMPGKGYLLETRLLPVAFRHGLDGLPALALRLKADNDPELLREVIEAMAASETAFFRDYVPFQRLKDDILPRMIRARAGTKTLRLWSAACATGQEAYSVAMLLRESGLITGDWKVEILATDISQEALAYARAGSYTQLEVQRGLPAHYLLKYFVTDDAKWQVQPDVRAMVRFSHVNLITGFGDIEACDIILCRYALQNFDVPMQAKVLQFLKTALAPDGVLVLGLGETARDAFRSLDPALGLFGNTSAA